MHWTSYFICREMMDEINGEKEIGTNNEDPNGFTWTQERLRKYYAESQCVIKDLKDKIDKGLVLAITEIAKVCNPKVHITF